MRKSWKVPLSSTSAAYWLRPSQPLTSLIGASDPLKLC
jgi:hypothetical protein